MLFLALDGRCPVRSRRAPHELAAGWFVAIEVMTALQNSQSNVLHRRAAHSRVQPCSSGGGWRAATLMIVVAAFTSCSAWSAFSLFLFYPQKRKFVLFSALWRPCIGLLPLLAVPPAQLVRLYQSWWQPAVDGLRPVGGAVGHGVAAVVVSASPRPSTVVDARRHRAVLLAAAVSSGAIATSISVCCCSATS